MTHTYTHSIYIGRFQPFHLGHAHMLRHALSIAERCIVVIGSAHQAATPKNPWNWRTRADMILNSLPPEQAARVDIVPLRDYYDATRWAHALRDAIDGVIAHHGTNKATSAVSSGPDAEHAPARIALISHMKDASSTYLKWFPEWETAAFPRQNAIDATPLRDAFFQSILDGNTPVQAARVMVDALPEASYAVLTQWAQQPDLPNEMALEWNSLRATRQAWSHSPYAPIFVTVDSVVQCLNHVLLVERDRRPGAGLMALPGGFLEEDERLLSAALRELSEETGLKLDLGGAQAQLQTVRVFDHPQRSERGRVVTHAHHIVLDAPELPKVQGGDDARSAQWVPIEALAELEPRMHNDHFHILDTLLHILKQPA